MAFNTGLSGLRAASVDLDVTGNNIANASTVGFKGSKVQVVQKGPVQFKLDVTHALLALKVFVQRRNRGGLGRAAHGNRLGCGGIGLLFDRC